MSQKPLDLIVENYTGGAGKPVLYLGDSTVERIAHQDEDRRTITEMLDAHLGGGVLGVSHSAYHPTVYKWLSRLFAVLPSKPRLAIIPVNLRSFSPIWEYHPEYQFTEEIERVNAYLRHGRLLSAVEVLRDKALRNVFFKRPLEIAGSGLERIADYKRVKHAQPDDEAGQWSRRRLLFMAHYLYVLAPDNRRLVDLAETTRSFLNQGINALIYLTPVNITSGVRHVGEAFAAGVRAKSRLILDSINAAAQTTNRRDRLVVSDLSTFFTGEYFFHRDDTMEHLNQDGRMAICKQLTNAIVSRGLIEREYARCMT